MRLIAIYHLTALIYEVMIIYALIVLNLFTSNFFQNETGYIQCYFIDQSCLFYFILFSLFNVEYSS